MILCSISIEICIVSTYDNLQQIVKVMTNRFVKVIKNNKYIPSKRKNRFLQYVISGYVNDE